MADLGEEFGFLAARLFGRILRLAQFGLSALPLGDVAELLVVLIATPTGRFRYRLRRNRLGFGQLGRSLHRRRLRLRLFPWRLGDDLGLRVFLPRRDADDFRFGRWLG